MIGRGKYKPILNDDGTVKEWELVSKPAPVPVAPYVHDDECDITSMVNGKRYTSKAVYRQHLRDAGYIEKGNDEETPNYEMRNDPIYNRQLEKDAQEVWYRLRDGMEPTMDELTKERCKVIDRNSNRYNYDRRELDEYGNPRE